MPVFTQLLPTRLSAAKDSPVLPMMDAFKTRQGVTNAPEVAIALTSEELIGLSMKTCANPSIPASIASWVASYVRTCAMASFPCLCVSLTAVLTVSFDITGSPGAFNALPSSIMVLM